MLAQYLLNRRRPSSPRDVLCLHCIFSTDDALRRPETYCACTVSSQPTTPFVAQRRTVLAQHLLNRRQRASPRRAVLCLHSIFSTDGALRRPEAYCACTASSQPTTPFVAQRRIVLAQHLLNRRHPSSRRDVLCLHSIFSTDDSAFRPAEAHCVHTAPRQHLFNRTQCAWPHRTDHVFAPRHAASPRPTTAHFAASKSTVFAQHIFFESERALRRPETYCACTAYSHPATAPFVA